MLLMILIFYIINYFIFEYKQRYKKIIKIFENETIRQKRISVILTVSYITFVFLYAGALLVIAHYVGISRHPNVIP